jgi:hypothetical protein
MRTQVPPLRRCEMATLPPRRSIAACAIRMPAP